MECIARDTSSRDPDDIICRSLPSPVCLTLECPDTPLLLAIGVGETFIEGAF